MACNGAERCLEVPAARIVGGRPHTGGTIDVNVIGTLLHGQSRAALAFTAGSAAGVVGAGVAAATTPKDGTTLGHDRSFWTGLGVGIAGAVALKTGFKHLPAQAVKDGVRALTPAAVKDWSAARAATKAAAPPPSAVARIAKGAATFAGVTALGTVPSYALLSATSGDRTLLGQGHEFWTGAVWGLAGVATLKTALSGSEFVKHAPLAAGWVASDFAALGLNAAVNGGDPH